MHLNVERALNAIVDGSFAGANVTLQAAYIGACHICTCIGSKFYDFHIHAFGLVDIFHTTLQP